MIKPESFYDIAVASQRGPVISFHSLEWQSSWPCICSLHHFSIEQIFFVSLLCARHYSVNWNTTESNTNKVFSHSENILVEKTAYKYANHSLVFLLGPLSLWEHPFTRPPPQTQLQNHSSGTDGLQSWLHQSSRTHFTAWRAQSLLNQKADILFASPFSFPIIPGASLSPLPSPSIQIPLPLTVYLTLECVLSSSGMVRHELWQARCGCLWTLHSKGIRLKAIAETQKRDGKDVMIWFQTASVSSDGAVTLPSINQERGQW